MFAKRYRGIPNEQLSFNLLNEPSGVSAAAYVNVAGKIVTAIRAQDPQRLIISDGLEWGRDPIPELAPLRIAQATRGYTPMDITHYKATWVSGPWARSRTVETGPLRQAVEYLSECL